MNRVTSAIHQRILAPLLLLIALSHSAIAAPPEAGTGAGGPFALSAGAHTINTTTGLIDGVLSPGFDGTAFNFTTIQIPVGATLVASGTQPLVLLANGSVDIGGVIIASGEDAPDVAANNAPGGRGGFGGPGGFNGGAGGGLAPGTGTFNGENGFGPGGGGGAFFGTTINAEGAGGGGAGHVNAGTPGETPPAGGLTFATSTGGSAGAAYASLPPFIGGSGGGGGSADDDIEPAGLPFGPGDDGAAGGGGGGGAIKIISASTLVVSGAIDASGGAGGEGFFGGSSGGGGGSGGTIDLVGAVLPSVTGTLNVNGGIGGFGNAPIGTYPGDGDGGAGSIGRTSVSLLPASGPLPVDDVITSTVGDAVAYPLANDGNPNVTIAAVSNALVTIDGDRRLIIPEGVTGTFTYTNSVGQTANITVVTATPLSNPNLFSGLLTNSGGEFVGLAKVAITATGYVSFQARVGNGYGTGRFPIPVGQTTGTGNSRLGPLTITLNTDGTLGVSLSASGGPFTGTLRPVQATSTAARYHVALASIHAAIPGGGHAVITIRPKGLAGISGRLPDGRPFIASSVISDNGSIAFFALQSKGVRPAGSIFGNLTTANLATTDITGEIAWTKPAQAVGAQGMHLTGVNTVLTANGCLYNGIIPINGPGTFTVSGGNFVAPESNSSPVSSGRPQILSGSVTFWGTNKPQYGTFRASVRQPGFSRVTNASGIYLPKSNTAWGYFSGSAIGGRITLTVP